MAAVPRERFMPLKMCSLAYIYQALHLRGDERVLEVGVGSGYGAALLSRLAAEAVTMERIPILASAAAERLTALGYDIARVHAADGTLGWPLAGPYDAIVVTAAAAVLPPAYLEQLKPGGRIVMHVGRLNH